jgi:Diaminopimelate decarboxylase
MRKSPNQNIMPLTAGVNGNNELTIGGITAGKLAEKYGTPLWIICQDTVEKCCADVMEGLSHYSGAYKPCYAGKAFLCQAMVKLIDQAGFGLDVVSEGELITALSVNMNAENIFCHGNNKTDSELNLAIEHKINVVVDNFEDLEKLVQLRRALVDPTIKKRLHTCALAYYSRHRSGYA